VLDLLSGLVDKSLVVFEGQGQAQRFRFLETIRAYAGDKLFESGEAGLLRDRHRDWCLALAERAQPELWGPASRTWLDRLEEEYANLRLALAWSIETAPEAAVRLGGSLWPFWFLRGDAEGRRWLEAILASATDDLAGRGNALLGAGFVARRYPTLCE